MPFSDPDHKYEIYRRPGSSIPLLILLLILSIPQFTYRFNHPEKSETQLFRDFFKAYKEFFNGMD